MKKKILIISIASNLLAGAFALMAFTSKPKATNDGGGFIVVRVLESENNMFSSVMTISDGASTIEKKELGTLRPKSEEEENTTVTSALNKLKGEGYTLIGTNGNGGVLHITNYIFEKK